MTDRRCPCGERATNAKGRPRCAECRKPRVTSYAARRRRYLRRVARGDASLVLCSKCALQWADPETGVCAGCTNGWCAECRDRTKHTHCVGDGTGPCGLIIPVGQTQCEECQRDQRRRRGHLERQVA